MQIFRHVLSPLTRGFSAEIRESKIPAFRPTVFRRDDGEWITTKLMLEWKRLPEPAKQAKQVLSKDLVSPLTEAL